MCKMIETKLTQAGIDFSIIDDKDKVVQFGLDNGIKSAPILAVDDKAYDSKSALQWLKERKNNE